MTETAKNNRINIRAKNGTTTGVNLSKMDIERLQHIQQFFLRSSNTKVSHAVIIRRAISYYLDIVIDELTEQSWSPSDAEELGGDELHSLEYAGEGISYLKLRPIGMMQQFPTFDSRVTAARQDHYTPQS